MAEIGQELGVGGPLSPAVLRARVYRYNLLLKKYWWLPVLFLSGSLLVQGVRFFLGEPLYMSAGRMMVSPRIMTGEAAVYTEELSNYFGTQVSLMQSEAIKHRASVAVESTHPDLKGSPCGSGSPAGAQGLDFHPQGHQPGSAIFATVCGCLHE